MTQSPAREGRRALRGPGFVIGLVIAVVAAVILIVYLIVQPWQAGSTINGPADGPQPTATR